jgi:CHAD domain-containing protein
MVIAGLKSKRYERIVMEWESFLNMGADESDRAGNGVVPVLATATRRIYARYQSVVKSGKQITDDSEDQMLHSLRIECKKLRYLMEFFASLFPQRKIDFLIKQLKKMQDNLGRFQDLSVQEDYLGSVMDHLPLTSQRVRKTSLAIGCLIGVLHREKQEEFKAFSRFFRQFSSTKNRELFRELFAN